MNETSAAPRHIALIIAISLFAVAAQGEVLVRAPLHDSVSATGRYGGEGEPPDGTPIGQAATLLNGAVSLQQTLLWRTHGASYQPITMRCGQVSLWFQARALPWEGRWPLYVAGQLAVEDVRLAIELTPDGSITATQNGATLRSPPGVAERGRWVHVAYAWDEHGHKLWINGSSADEGDASSAVDGIYHLRLGGAPGLYADLLLTDTPTTVQPGSSPRVIDAGEIDTKRVDALRATIEGAKQLQAQSPPGSDAWVRRRLIEYWGKQRWRDVASGVIPEYVEADLDWMARTVAGTKPGKREGERDVPMFDATTPIRIEHGHLVQNGRRVFIVGWLTGSTPIDRDLGFNVQGAAIGPQWTFSESSGISSDGSSVASSIDRAASNGAVFDVLYSPHMMPHWAYEHDKVFREGGCFWIRHNIESPLAESLHRATIDVTFPKLAGHGSTLFVDLANEPLYTGASPTTTLPAWRTWLTVEHNTIDDLNAAWGTSYSDFTQIPLPDDVPRAAVEGWQALKIPSEPAQMGMFYDWCRFNDDRLTDWLGRLHDRITMYRPDALFHLKIHPAYGQMNPSIAAGVNPVRKLRHLDLGEADTSLHRQGRDESFSMSRAGADVIRFFSMLRSLAPDKPLMNSELHLFSSPTEGMRFPESDFYYSSMLLRAMVGLDAMILWHIDDPLGYQLSQRAEAVDGVSRAARDMRRFADEWTAVQDAPARIGVVCSTASLTRYAHLPEEKIWDQPNHGVPMLRLTQAFSFTGRPIGFVLEEQSEDIDRYDAIVVPQAPRLTNDLSERIRRFAESGKPVLILGDEPALDPYGRPILPLSSNCRRVPYTVDTQRLITVLSDWLNEASIVQPVSLTRRDGTNGGWYGVQVRPKQVG